MQTPATAMILCHNHPSGSGRPSNDDIRVAESLRLASTVMNIRLLDHLVYAEDYRFYRFITSLAAKSGGGGRGIGRSTLGIGDNNNYFTIILSIPFVDNSKITIFELLN